MNTQDLQVFEQMKKINIMRIIIVLLVLFIVSIPCVLYMRVNVQMHHALRMAKDVRISMKMLQTERYGEEESLFSKYNKDGLAIGMQERIQELSQTSGKITVLSWNEKKHEVTEFIYEEGRYTVHYSGTEDHCEWKIDYSIPVGNYTS